MKKATLDKEVYKYTAYNNTTNMGAYVHFGKIEGARRKAKKLTECLTQDKLFGNIWKVWTEEGYEESGRVY